MPCLERTVVHPQLPIGARTVAFSLIEIMVVLAVVGILLALAVPVYQGYSVRAYRTQAQADLLRCAQGMERHASLRFSYRSAIDSDADGVGDLDAGSVTPNVCTPTSTQYRIDLVESGIAGFLLRASAAQPGNAVDGDGDLALDEAGGRFWDRDGDGDFGPGEDRW